MIEIQKLGTGTLETRDTKRTVRIQHRRNNDEELTGNTGLAGGYE